MEAGQIAVRGDGRLWAVALGLSVLLNAAILALAGISAIRSEVRAKPLTPEAAEPTVVTIYPEDVMLEAPAAENPPLAAEAAAEPAPPPAVPVKPRFARTSADQDEVKPDGPAFIGERNTIATSDRAPVAGAPDLPSQKGLPPRHAGELETTDSRYQDGNLDGGARPQQAQAEAAPPQPASPADSDPAMAARPAAAPPPPPAPPPAREPLLGGTDPVEVRVPKAVESADAPKPTPPRPATEPAESPRETPPDATAGKSAPATQPPAPKPIEDPAFRGNQRKTAIVGSISRSGRSALNVNDTPLGRYQAQISRAVELEWQRNCVRHRDFITPGFLTVRFFVEPSGKVRTVQFVGKMETGEVQKGFTLNSIRDAEIPPMPAALKKDFAKEPLELIFNFYF